MVIMVAVVVVISIVVIYLKIEKKRKEALKFQAMQMGFSFSDEVIKKLPEHLAKFHLFSQGHRRRITNLMESQRQQSKISIFDYQYTTGGGRNSHTWRQTVILFESDRLHLPMFSLRPEKLFHKIGKVFGYRDINFEHRPEFSNKFLLKSQDEEMIRKIFLDDILSFFENHPKLCAEGMEKRLICYYGSKRCKPEELTQFLDTGIQLLNLFQHRSN